jgi:hypothetical protein
MLRDQRGKLPLEKTVILEKTSTLERSQQGEHDAAAVESEKQSAPGVRAPNDLHLKRTPDDLIECGI